MRPNEIAAGDAFARASLAGSAWFAGGWDGAPELLRSMNALA